MESSINATAPGVPYEQVIAIKGLAAKRAQSAANAARIEVEKLPAQIANVSDEAVKARLYKKFGALRTLQEHYQGIAVAISDDLMTHASAAGSEVLSKVVFGRFSRGDRWRG